MFVKTNFGFKTTFRRDELFPKYQDTYTLIKTPCSEADKERIKELTLQGYKPSEILQMKEFENKTSMHNTVKEVRTELAALNLIKKSNAGRRKKVGQYNLEGNLIAQFKCVKEACQGYKFDYDCVKACCEGKSKKHKGYVWKYIEN